MEIVEVSVEPLDVELTEPFGIATGAQLVANNALVAVRLADGAVGLGEAAPFPAVSGETQRAVLDAVRDVRPLIVGRDARGWRRLAADLAEALPALPSAQVALETAVLDAVGRSSRISLWTLFGGAESELVTDVTIVTGSVEAAREAALRAVAWGFSTLKIKIGGGDVDRDIDRVLEVAGSTPETRLILDANASLSESEALALLDALESVAPRVALFEQPTARGDWDAMARVAERSAVPIAADESVRSTHDVVELVRHRAASVVNVKTTKCGLAEAMDIAATARAHGLGLMIGGMVETELAMTTSACLAAGLGGFAAIDLDTPRFLRHSPFAGSTQWGPRLPVAHIRAGHGCARARSGSLARGSP